MKTNTESCHHVTKNIHDKNAGNFKKIMMLLLFVAFLATSAFAQDPNQNSCLVRGWNGSSFQTAVIEACLNDNSNLMYKATASVPSTFSWTISNNSSGASIVGSSTSEVVVVNHGNTAGSFFLKCTVIAIANNDTQDCAVSVAVYDPKVKAENVSRCGPGTVTFYATDLGTPEGNARWYDAPSGGSLLHTGTSFTPNVADTTNFWVAGIIVTPFNQDICETSRVKVTATVYPPATSNAGDDQAVCANSPNVTLAGSVGGGASSGTWSGGTGTFNPNATTLNAVYTPSAAEITAGMVTLTLTTNDPEGPCPAVSDYMKIIIKPIATVNAGDDKAVCANSPSVTLAGSVGGAAISGTWSGGTGTFNPNATTLNAVYTPSLAEIAAGMVTLTLTTNDPEGPCPAVSDTMKITINSNPQVTPYAVPSFCKGTGILLLLSTLRDNIGAEPTATVNWYNDAGHLNLITEIDETLLDVGITTIYAQVTNAGDTQCSAATTVQFSVLPRPSVHDFSISGCLGSLDNIELPAYNGNITSELLGNVTITWYSDLDHLIPVTTTGVLSVGPHTFYAKIENNSTQCLAFAKLIITINSLPEIKCPEAADTTVQCGVTAAVAQQATNTLFNAWSALFTYDTNLYTVAVSYEKSIDNGPYVPILASDVPPLNPLSGHLVAVKATWTLTNKVTNCKNSCSSTFSITNGCALTCNAIATNLKCNGDNSGSISVNAGGGVLPYNFYLYKSPNTPVTQILGINVDPVTPAQVTFSGLAAGDYYVLGTDATTTLQDPSTRCDASITEPAPVTLVTSHTDGTCDGAANGKLIITSSSGTGTPVYSLSSDGVTFAPITEAALEAGSYGPGTYTIQVCYPNGQGNGFCCLTKTETILPNIPIPIVLTCPDDKTENACKEQCDVDTHFTAWLQSFSYTGGTNPVLTITPSSPMAPLACGGATTVTWTVTDDCGQSESCTKTFTVSSPPPVVLTCGEDVVVGACSSQQDINDKWAAFLASTTASGGCNGVLSNNAPKSPPSKCGGYVDVKWTYKVSKCYDADGDHKGDCKCGCHAKDHKGNYKGNHKGDCKGDCKCGCHGGDSKGNLIKDLIKDLIKGLIGHFIGDHYDHDDDHDEIITCTKRFTIAPAPAVVLNRGDDVTLPACSSDGDIQAAWNAFLSSPTVSDGCDGNAGVLTRTSANPPSKCGGYVDVKWTYTASGNCNPTIKCGLQTAQGKITFTKRFTITPATVVINIGDDVTLPACSSDGDIQAAWNAFLTSPTVSDGCDGNTGGVLTRTSANLPSKCGGYVDVKWTYTASGNCNPTIKCGSQTVKGKITFTKRFKIAPATVVINIGDDVTLPACSSDGDIQAAWNAFLASPTVSDGCDGNTGGVLTRTSANLPSKCGGYVDVKWTYTASGNCNPTIKCGLQTAQGKITFTKRFKITPATVVINRGDDVTLSACNSEGDIQAAWNAFLASPTVSDGCNGNVGGVLTRTSANLPSKCGGYVDVKWTYTASGNCNPTIKCGTQTAQGKITFTKRFTITPATVKLNCANDVVMPKGSTQAQINAAWASFLASATVSAGCDNIGTLTHNAPANPPACGHSVVVKWTFKSSGNCNPKLFCGLISGYGTISCSAKFNSGPCCSCPAPPNHYSKGVDVGENAEFADFKVFPNPFTNVFSLSLNTSSVDKVGVSVFDMTGRMIEQREVDPGNVSEIQIGDRYPSGMYNLIISQGTEVKTLRVIKQ